MQDLLRPSAAGACAVVPLSIVPYKLPEASATKAAPGKE
jgi:hypothetical protein